MLYKHAAQECYTGRSTCLPSAAQVVAQVVAHAVAHSGAVLFILSPAVARLDACVQYSVGCVLNMLPLYRHNILIEATTPIAHIPKVAEYECSVDIKSTGNDVFAVFSGKPL